MATVVAESVKEVLEVEDCARDGEAGTERLSVCENSLYYTDETTESHLKNKKVVPELHMKCASPHYIHFWKIILINTHTHITTIKGVMFTFTT